MLAGLSAIAESAFEVPIRLTMDQSNSSGTEGVYIKLKEVKKLSEQDQRAKERLRADGPDREPRPSRE